MQRPAVPDSWKKLAEGRRQIGTLYSEDRFIARSELQSVLDSCRDVRSRFLSLEADGMLSAYARKNHISARQLRETLSFFDRSDRMRKQHNRKFIDENLISLKEYFDHILDDIDTGICLDEQQRRMVLNDEDYCLVIAGAGAGKTTSVAAKVKYLADRRCVSPNEILVISFTNKAVQELRGRIQKKLNLPCYIATFHSVGNTILRRENPDRLNIADPSLKYTAVMQYFQRRILRDEALVHKLILFFSYYLDPVPGTDPEEFFRAISLRRYTTLRSDLGEINVTVRHASSKKPVTIQNEIVRSMQEAQIANFLYLNGINYEYEPLYPYEIPGSRKPYTPDFLLRQENRLCYLEHFGLSEEGENNRYTKQQLEAYKKAAVEKARLHRRCHTDLIWTFSSYSDGQPLIAHLREQLEKHGFILQPRPEKEVLEKLFVQAETTVVRKLVILITRFITGFKTDGFSLEDFDRMKRESKNVRTDLFLDICRACYLEYERVLTEENATDFEDMINDSAKILQRLAAEKRHPESPDKTAGAEKSGSTRSFPAFRYVIVDEYQDISRQRFDLVKALRDATGAKIIAVGDDWQSIFAFSGSDISLFTQFRKKMGYASLLKIENTYRNSQEVIDIAGGFIQKNTAQIIKTLQSDKHITDPVVVITYDNGSNTKNGQQTSAETAKAVPGRKNTSANPAGTDNTGSNPSCSFGSPAEAVEHALDEIVRHNNNRPDNLSILVLGRFGFDGYNLSRSPQFTFRDYGSRIISAKYPKLNISFMTAHASKGLGYDDVILINGKDDRYGFPSQIDDDPILSYVYHEDRAIDYAEERRLFYVAMTRTQNRVWMIAPQNSPSRFILELLKDYENVKLEGRINARPVTGFTGKRCPLCGYPLQLRFKKSIGLPLYICTNEPELCGFMTNNLKGGTLQIQKCDCCRDGYLIVRENRRTGQMFLGCTNYRADKKGCSRSI